MKKFSYLLVIATVFTSVPLSIFAQTKATTYQKDMYSIFSQVLSPSSKAGQVSGQDPQMLQGQDPQMIRAQDPQMLQGQDPQMIRSQDPQMLQGQDPQMIRFK